MTLISQGRSLRVLQEQPGRQDLKDQFIDLRAKY